MGLQPPFRGARQGEGAEVNWLTHDETKEAGMSDTQQSNKVKELSAG